MMGRALVTGASSGIGLACARELLGAGFDVAAQYRTGTEAVSRLVRDYGGDRVTAIRADLGDEAGCRAAVDAAAPFDVLVHSAGIWNAGPIRDLSRQTLETMFRVNTFSAFYLARDAALQMETGSMVFIGSTAGQRGEPGHSHYAGSKAALWGLVQSLAQELAPGIRVNLVSPGWVRTPMAEPAFADGTRLARIIETIPLRRVGEADDVAAAVRFLVEPRQCHLTGVDLPVSGGALLPLPRG